MTDRWLGDYANLFGDMSAVSGCSDGHGAGYNNPAAPRMAGKCLARETLSLLKRSTSPVIFQKIVWGTVNRLLRIPVS